MTTPQSSPEISSPRRRSLIMAGAVAAVAPAWVGTARAQTTPIKIGFPVPLTGAFSAEAQDQVRAAEIAVADFNQSGGFNGRKAELVVRDD